jgi:hypothetical protein
VKLMRLGLLYFALSISSAQGQVHEALMEALARVPLDGGVQLLQQMDMLLMNEHVTEPQQVEFMEFLGDVASTPWLQAYFITLKEPLMRLIRRSVWFSRYHVSRSRTFASDHNLSQLFAILFAVPHATPEDFFLVTLAAVFLGLFF